MTDAAHGSNMYPLGGDGSAHATVVLDAQFHGTLFDCFSSGTGSCLEIWNGLPVTLASMNPPRWESPNWFLCALWPLVAGRTQKPIMELVKRATLRARKDPQFAEALWGLYLVTPQAKFPRAAAAFMRKSLGR